MLPRHLPISSKFSSSVWRCDPRMFWSLPARGSIEFRCHQSQTQPTNTCSQENSSAHKNLCVHISFKPPFHFFPLLCPNKTSVFRTSKPDSLKTNCPWLSMKRSSRKRPWGPQRSMTSIFFSQKAICSGGFLWRGFLWLKKRPVRKIVKNWQIVRGKKHIFLEFAFWLISLVELLSCKKIKKGKLTGDGGFVCTVSQLPELNEVILRYRQGFGPPKNGWTTHLGWGGVGRGGAGWGGVGWVVTFKWTYTQLKLHGCWGWEWVGWGGAG